MASVTITTASVGSGDVTFTMFRLWHRGRTFQVARRCLSLGRVLAEVPGTRFLRSGIETVPLG